MRVRWTGADGSPVGIEELQRKHHEERVASPEVDIDRGGPCPHELLPGVETIEVPCEGGSKEGEAAGDRGDRQKAASHYLLDAPDEGEVSLSRIQPRGKSCVDERVIRIEAGP